jgi:hypothetical protein
MGSECPVACHKEFQSTVSLVWGLPIDSWFCVGRSWNDFNAAVAAVFLDKSWLSVFPTVTNEMPHAFLGSKAASSDLE